MDRKFFDEEFIDALRKKIPHRPELVKEVSRILKIEKEPASRRLNGNVSFSVNEMGALARELSISLDTLLHKGDQLRWVPYIFELPWRQTSFDPLITLIEEHIARSKKICSAPRSEFGAVYGSLPLEFFMPYDELMKFFLFKWGVFFVGTDEFNDYASWEVPDRFYPIREKLSNLCINRGKVMYIWDDTMIWALVKELSYLCVMHTIDDESRERIRTELHRVLTDIEAYIKKLNDSAPMEPEVSFYISTVQIGVNSWYHISEKGYSAFFETHFTRTPLSEDPESCLAIREWINSLKTISYMVSGSGHKERRLFFEEQHRIIDSILDHK